ncbi:MAG: hypothetical protein DCC52_03825, partial [Chloroflexi bacterium]
MKFLRLVIPLLALALFFVGGSASFAAGGGPGDALYADGSAQTLAPHGELWFRFDYGGANQIDTPQAIADWQNGAALKEIGSGGNVQNHALGWSGRFNFPGVFYVVAHNDGAAPVSINVT